MPLLPLTLAVGAGMVVAHFWGFGLYCALIAGIFLILCGVFGLAHKIVVGILGIGIGCILGTAAEPVACPVPYGEKYFCSGTVETAREQSRGQSLLLRIDSINYTPVTPFLVSALYDDTENIIDPGQRICFDELLASPRPAIDFPDQIDYDSLSLSKGIVAKTFLTKQAVRYVSPDAGFLSAMKRQRGKLKNILAKTDVNYDTWSFLCATLAGDSSALDPDERAQFSRAGLAHILALSGLHVGIIAMLFSLLLLPLRFLVGRRGKALILILVIWGYAAMTGLSTSVVRAAIMITVALLAVWGNLRHSAPNALCVAALLIALFGPAQVFTLGFALSFLAVAGILIFARHLSVNPRMSAWVRYPTGVFAATLGATLLTAPVVAYCFHTFPTAFLLSNFLAGPLLFLLVAGGAVMALLASVGVSFPWLADALNRVYALLQDITHAIAGWKYSGVDSIYMHPLMPWLLLGALALLALFLRYRKKHLLAGVGAVLALCIVIAVTEPALAEQGDYFLRRSDHTGLLLHRGDSLWYYTTLKGQAAEVALADVQRRARDFVGRRKIVSVSLLPDTCRKPGIMSRGPLVQIADVTYWFDAGLADKEHAVPGKINCYVACKGGPKDVVAQAQKVGADSVLLSSDLSRQKRDRLKRELQQSGIPFRSIE